MYKERINDFMKETMKNTATVSQHLVDTAESWTKVNLPFSQKSIIGFRNMLKLYRSKRDTLVVLVKNYTKNGTWNEETDMNTQYEEFIKSEIQKFNSITGYCLKIDSGFSSRVKFEEDIDIELVLGVSTCLKYASWLLSDWREELTRVQNSLESARNSGTRALKKPRQATVKELSEGIKLFYKNKTVEAPLVTLTNSNELMQVLENGSIIKVKVPRYNNGFIALEYEVFDRLEKEIQRLKNQVGNLQVY